jgi:hypothetical protein
MTSAMFRGLALTTAVGALLLGAVPAATADHIHFRVVGSGGCVLLAQDGGESHVVLPHHEALPEERRHPLHVNVHLGRPGEVGTVMVAYAGGELTAAALELCSGEFLNE